MIDRFFSLFPTINFTSADFKVEPDELYRQSRAVADRVAGIRMKFDEMEAKVNSSGTYWKGEAADIYRSTYAGFKEEILEILSRLSEHIIDLEKMAGVYERTEASVTEMIETLPSDVIM